MAEPVRIYTPRRDAREELRRKVESAPIDHAEALLSWYELLQEANDHGVLDTLRGAIGAGEAIIGKASEYANTPEGIRLMRNLLAMTRVLAGIDPALLDAAAKAMAEHEQTGSNSEPPSLWHSLQRLTGRDSRRALAVVAGFTQAFGRAQNTGERNTVAEAPSSRGPVTPVIAVALVAIIASFWIGRRSLSE